jgi:hypothetical protein
MALTTARLARYRNSNGYPFICPFPHALSSILHEHTGPMFRTLQTVLHVAMPPSWLRRQCGAYHPGTLSFVLAAVLAHLQCRVMQQRFHQQPASGSSCTVE